MAREVIGLIPAAGHASRIAPLPCSKELFPIGFRSEPGRETRPKAVSHYLLEKMRFAGISKAYIILRKGKWDIPAYFGDGSIVDMDLAYLALDSSWSVPFTLDQAYPFVRDAVVAFGFPDILFSPSDAFTRLMARLSETQADFALGLCPTTDISKYDAVQFDGDGRIENLIVKPAERILRYSWAIALWTPAFTEFLHRFVMQNECRVPDARELVAGDVIQASITAGLKGEAVILSEEPCLDIGTPGDLEEAVRQGVHGLI